MSSMKRGFALVTVLAVLIMIALGAAAILSSVEGHALLKSGAVRELQNQYIAEAGMQWAIWDCKTTPAHCSDGVDRTTTIENKEVLIKTTGTPGDYKFVVTVD